MHKSNVQGEMQNKRKGLNSIVAFGLLFCAMLLPTAVFASTTGAEFQAVYDFVFNAATGYLGRSIAIAGGLIGLGFGAASGKPVIAVVGIVLAIFGALGPAIINGIFGSALI
jgi:conjugal transfer pilus assembly protein TraA